MTQIAEQVHNKFKIFSGQLDADKTVGDLANQIAVFASDNKIAAKSIGIEYLETAQRLIISLGYRTDEEHYPIQINTVSLGKVDAASTDFAALEQKMSEASEKLDNIICHELYVTDEQEFLMVLMTHQND